MTFKIVTFDSDGVGAIASALILHRIDPKGELVKQAEMFAGNGMGAVTALALASGLDLGDLIAAFRRNAPGFFGLRDANGVYSPEAMIKALASLYGVARLCELPLSGAKVMVNVDRLEDPETMRWERYSIGNGRHDRFSDMLLSDLAVSACSHEAHFPPHTLMPLDHPSRGKFRTAMSADANPAADAIAYAGEFLGIDPADISILSLGSGGDTSLDLAAREREQRHNSRSWAWPFSRIARSLSRKSGLNTVDSNCRVSALGEQYVRLDVPGLGRVEFDEWQRIDAIVQAVEVQCGSPLWQSVIAELRGTWSADDEFALISHPPRVGQQGRR